jgi:peptidoglycan/xylan/chitin deacetylase (PgdA/CDA1 family)
MNWRIWRLLEADLYQLNISPVMAVIPDNRDRQLMVSAPDNGDFWQHVRCWQERGWTIGMHGYQHCYLTTVAGMYGRIPRSEFAGLPYEIQEIKLRNAIRIFRENGVSPAVWVAPAHSFDLTTVSILSKLGVRIISDGYAIYPYQDDDGVTWIPQQVAKFRKLPFGIWTICCHINEWTDADTDRFRQDLRKYRDHFTAVIDVVNSYCERRRSWLDAGANRLLDLGLRIARPLRNNLRRSRTYLPNLRISAPHPLTADDD